MKNVMAVLLSACLSTCGSGQKNPATAQGETGDPGTSGSTANVSDGDFGVTAGDAKSAGGVSGSKLRSTATEAVLKLIVQNDRSEPIPGVVIRVTDPDGQKQYTPETDAMGYTELLVPIGRKYLLTYLSLFKDPVEKSATIPAEPNVTMKLTLTWIPLTPPPLPPSPDLGVEVPIEQNKGPALILDGVVFDTAKATLKPESYPHLEGVIEYMTYKPSAFVELSGHTDNQGNPKKNLKLSEDRAMAVRDYLISKGIDETRIVAVGYGQERPIATNDTEEGRQKNRRTEARDITP